MSDQHIYLFVREDISRQQQIIQTAHAVDALNKQHPYDGIHNMVLLKATDEEHLLDIMQYVSSSNIEHHMFYEPDVSEYTAIATRPLKQHERGVFAHFDIM